MKQPPRTISLRARRRPPHPGEAIGPTLEALGLPVAYAARCLDVTPAELQSVIDGTAALSAELAVKIGVIDIEDPFTLLLMQKDFDLWAAYQHLDASNLLIVPDEVNPKADTFTSHSPRTVARCYAILEEFTAAGRRLAVIYDEKTPRARVIEMEVTLDSRGSYRHRILASLPLARARDPEFPPDKYWQDDETPDPIIKETLYSVIAAKTQDTPA